MNNDTNPFKGRVAETTMPTRVLHRFTKPGGHWAEIRERKVIPILGIEFIVFMDGSLLDSQLFYNGREPLYPAALQARIDDLLEGGWIEEHPAKNERVDN